MYDRFSLVVLNKLMTILLLLLRKSWTLLCLPVLWIVHSLIMPVTFLVLLQEEIKFLEMFWMSGALTSWNSINSENLLPVFYTQYLKGGRSPCFLCSCWLLEGYCWKHNAEGLNMLPLRYFTSSMYGRVSLETSDNSKWSMNYFLIMHNRKQFTPSTF